MAMMNKLEAVEFIIRDAPRDLVDIKRWIDNNKQYCPLLLDHFKCRMYQLPQMIYDFKD